MPGEGVSRRALGRLALGLTAAAVGGPALGAAPAGPLPRARAELIRFASAPFPYNGVKPDDGTDFLDMTGPDGRVGHTSPRGGIYYADQTYSDQRVLVALPAGFNLRRRAVIVVFFHGNNATLQRDVLGRQRVFDQLQASGLNAALVAPQFAVNALDSSAGRFWLPGAFAQFMGEASGALARLWGSAEARRSFSGLPIILVAYSGGYNPAAYVLKAGGAGHRIRGVILLDALVAEADKFARWIAANHRSAFFFSAYSEAAADGNSETMRRLAAAGIPYGTGLPRQLAPGVVDFVATAGVDHDDYVTSAWVDDPLAWLLARIPGYPR
ncbi:MAG TPA: hypothetical protein VHB23_16925 [Devosiaceae bacterium]|jgi:hypothetical protein|nr:hypothetical protein [Devosiaceae bacterium]